MGYIIIDESFTLTSPIKLGSNRDLYVIFVCDRLCMKDLSVLLFTIVIVIILVKHNIYIYIYIYTYIHTYIHTHTFQSCLLQYCNIYCFVSQCMFSHTLHDQVFNLPHRFFSSLVLVVNHILIQYKAT